MKIKITCRPQQSLWLKKNISKALVFGLLLNNIYINSNASDIEIPNRYEILEGEYIIIDNSEQGELHEIEVFGNTVQDENNLEDIQSVGDLYVDNEGNPILDSQGRKQYKIEIVSTNYNRLYTNEEMVNLYNNMGYSNVKAELTEDNLFKVVANGAWQSPNKVFKGKPNTEYTFSFVSRPEWIYTNGLTLTHNYSDYVKTYRTDSTGEFGFLISPEIGATFDFKIYEGNIPGIKEIIENKNKTTILLPQPLLSLNSRKGNKKLSDRLFWSDELERYIIEKNISTINIKGFNNKYNRFFQVPDIENPDDINLGLLYNYEYRPFVEKMEYSGWGILPTNSNYGIGVYSSGNIRCYQKSDIDTTLDELNDYIGDDGITMYTQLYDSQVIETNITSKLKIPTYDGETYIYVETENGINPTLKITVDNAYKIAKEAMEEAENNPTKENISLAKIYINMLPESIYKEELQGRLYTIAPELNPNRNYVTANLDVYIKSENMLLMNLSTNSVSFENYSGVDEIEKTNAVEISINSSLPYQLNAYLLDEMYNSDKTKKIDMDRLQIKDNTEDNYSEFVDINEKLVLKDSCESGNDKSHSIDLKLKGGNAYESDIYKTVIKFEAEQK